MTNGLARADDVESADEAKRYLGTLIGRITVSHMLGHMWMNYHEKTCFPRGYNMSPLSVKTRRDACGLVQATAAKHMLLMSSTFSFPLNRVASQFWSMGSVCRVRSSIIGTATGSTARCVQLSVQILDHSGQGRGGCGCQALNTMPVLSGRLRAQFIEELVPQLGCTAARC